MKLKLFFISLFAFSISANAQEKCIELENQLSNYIEKQEYKEAYTTWQNISSSCAKFSQKSYVLANQVLQFNVDNAIADVKPSAIKELAAFYDVFDKNFPENKNGNLVKKAMLLYENKAANNDEVFTLLQKAILKDANQFTTPKPLYDYYYLLQEKYQEKKVTFGEVYDNYSNVLTILDKNKDIYHPDEYATAKMAVTNLLQQNLNSENLSAYIESQFETNKNNLNWLTHSGSLLLEKAPKNSILEKVALQIESIQPSYLSSVFLANYYLKNHKQPEAINYFEKAVSNTQKPLEKADVAYKAASIVMLQDPAKAKQFIDIAIENAPTDGKNYVFLATLYENAVNQCATTKDEQAAIYQLASQTVLKAEKAEARYKSTAQYYSDQYLKKLQSIGKPKKKSITLNCWINQTVQF